MLFGLTLGLGLFRPQLLLSMIVFSGRVPWFLVMRSSNSGSLLIAEDFILPVSGDFEAGDVTRLLQVKNRSQKKAHGSGSLLVVAEQGLLVSGDPETIVGNDSVTLWPIACEGRLSGQTLLFFPMFRFDC